MILLPLCTAFCWGLSSVFDKLSMNAFSPVMVFIVGGIVYALVALGLLIYHRNHVKHYFYDYKKYKVAWIYAILAAVCVYGVANLIYYYALNASSTPHIVIALSYSAPIFTLLLSIIVLKEDFSMASIIGVILVVLGTFIVCYHSKGAT